MESQALQNAKARREEVAAEHNRVTARAEELKRLLVRIDQFIVDHEAFEAGELPPQTTEMSSGSTWSATTTLIRRPNLNLTTSLIGSARSRNSKKEEVAAATRALIAETRHPIARPELLRLLQERGLTITGNAPETVLSTMLWRTRDTHGIVHLRGYGYWLKEKHWDEAQYDPDLDSLMGIADNSPPEGVSDGDDDE
jgi:hypothetical protein